MKQAFDASGRHNRRNEKVNFDEYWGFKWINRV